MSDVPVTDEPVTEFPSSESFEVWEVTWYGGQYRAEGDLPREAAVRAAAQYQAEVEGNYRMESGGPVPPRPPPRFVVVRVTETREVLA